MKLRVKTLKGSQFTVDVDDAATVADAKAAIHASQGFEVGKMIHSGKVLRDDSVTLAAANVKDEDFLVVMPTKKKKALPKPAKPAASPTAAPAAAPAAADPPANAAAASTTAAATAPAVPDEKVAMLTGMGFPAEEARRALAMAFGNTERAAQYLLEGIPAGVRVPPAPSAAVPAPAAVAPPTSAAPSAATSGADPLEPLRNHAQFNQLRALVQTNPGALPAVLQQIGQASPGLLALINNNMEAFVKMLNEPISGSAGGAAPAAAGTPAPAAAAAGAMGGMPAGMAGMMGGLGGMNPAMMLSQIQSMTPEQRTQLANAVGVTPEQLTSVAQTMATMPPEMLQQLVAQRMGAAGAPGAAGAASGLPPGVTVVHLTAEEKAAVDRLVELGFSRQQAAEAYLACDKNETMAANFLFQNMDS